MMWALHGAALRTRLNDNRGCSLVRVTSAFFALGCTSLWYGHDALDLMRDKKTVRKSFALSAQSFPPGIDGRRTRACAGITIGSASYTEAETIFATQGEPWHRQQPLFANGRTHVNLTRVWRQLHDIVLICFVRTGFRKQQRHIVLHGHGNIDEATTTRGRRRTIDVTAEVETPRTCCGQPARYVYSIALRARVVGFPHRISRAQHAIYSLGPSFQAADVKIQHSHEK